jgi:hypothetical protein
MVYAINTLSRMNCIIHMKFAFIMINHISRISGDCCDSIAISSTSIAVTYQEHQLGVYTKVYDLTVNNRPVYKQNKGDQYAYYWVGVICFASLTIFRFCLQIFDEGRHDDGENWLVSVDYDNWRHGTESANMKGEMKEDGDGGLDPCVTDDCGNQCISEVNHGGVPFTVWTVLHRNWGWVRDTTLRSVNSSL